jgi:hypothetical protein
MSLDANVLTETIQEAERKWFSQHSGKYDFESHTSFVGQYIVKNYDKKLREAKAHP